MIVAGSASQSLAVELAAETGREIASVSYQRFPDGEQQVQVGQVSDDVIIVAATRSDGAHIELLQLQDALREAGTEQITTVLPYMGYARQDRAFETGQPVSARAVGEAIGETTDQVLVVNPHEETVCEFFSTPTETVDAAGRLAVPLPELTDPLFVAPDEGATDLAATVRDAYGRGETDHFVKTRHAGDDVEIEPRACSVTDRDVVLVDDIIATGSTMSESVEILRERDAASVTVTCVHPRLAGNARLKLARAGVRAIYGTDTIECAESVVSVAPAIADTLGTHR